MTSARTLLGLVVFCWSAWAVTPAEAQITFLEGPQGHTDPVYAVAYSPDGKLVVTGGFDYTVKLWDRASGRCLRTIKDHTNLVLSVAISPDGKQLASGSLDKTVKLYDVPLRDPIADLGAQPGEVTAVAISPDGKLLVTADKAKNLKVWDAASNQHLRDLAGGARGEVTSLVVSPNNAFVLAAGVDGSVQGWNLADGVATGVLTCPGVQRIALLPDNRTLVAACQDGVGRVFNWPPTAPKLLVGATQPVQAVAISFDGQVAAAASADGQVRLYGVADGAPRSVIQAGGPVRSVAFSRDNQSVLTGDAAGTIKVWKVADGTAVTQWEAHAGPVRDLAFHNNGAQLASAGDDGLVRLWSWPATATRDTTPHAAPIRSLAISPNNALLATASDDKTVKLINPNDGAEARALAGHEGQVWAAVFSNNNAQVATGSEDKKIRLFNVGNGALVREIEGHAAAVKAVAISPNGQQVAGGGADNLIKLWNAADGAALRDVPGHGGPIVGLFFTPDGSKLVSAGDTTIRTWNVADAAAAGSINTGAQVRSLGIARDGQTYAAGGADNKIRLYKPDGTAGPVLEGHGGAIVAVTFSADGKRLLSTSADKTARLWDVATGAELQKHTLPAVPVGAAPAADLKSVHLAAEDGHLRTLPLSGLGVLKGHQGAVASLSYASNGNHLVTGGADKTVRLWSIANLADLKQERTFDGSAAAVLDVAVSADNQWVAAGGEDKHVRVWKFADGAAQPAVATPAAVNSVVFSPDNKRLAAAGADNQARLYELTTSSLGEAFPHAGPVLGVAFTPNSQVLATVGADNAGQLWTPAAVRSKSLHPGPIPGLAVLGGTQFLTGGQDGQVLLWNVGDLNQARKYEGTAGPIQAVAVSGNNQFVVAGGDDKNLRIWNAAGQPLVTTPLPAAITRLAINADAKKVIAVGADNVIRNLGYKLLQNVHSLDLGQEMQGHAGVVTGVALATDGSALFSGSLDKTVKRWLPASVEPRLNLPGHAQHIYGLAFSPDGDRLASAGADNVIKLWNTADGKNVANCTGHTAQVYGVVYHPTNNQLISCSGDKTIRIWNAADGKQVSEIKEEIGDVLYSIDRSPDGSKFVAGGLDKIWRLWKLGETKPTFSGSGHSDHIYRVAYNPKGTRIATLGYAGALFVWDEAGNKMFQQSLPVKAAYSLAWSPDGTELAVATSDNRVLLVKVPQPAQ